MGRISPTLTAESPRTPTARIPRTEARAGMAMSLATFAMAAASAAQAVLYLSLFGATEQTDGFFVAFAVYTTFGVFSQSLRLTSVPLLIEPTARLTVREFAAGLGLVAVPVLLLTEPLAGRFASVIAPGLGPSGRSVTESALMILGPAIVLQLWAAGAATVLAVRGNFSAVATSYIAGAAAGLIVFLLLMETAGELTLGWSMLAMAVVTASSMGLGVRASGGLDGGREPLRVRPLLGKTGLLLGRTLIYLALNLLFVVTLAYASRSVTGDTTVLSYAYLFASYLVAGTGMALAANTATLLAIQSTYSADFASYANSAVAFFIGVVIAEIVTRIARGVGAEWVANRLVLSNWKALAVAAERRGQRDRAEFAGLMLHRLGLLVQRIAYLSESDRRDTDSLAQLRIGINIIDLRRARYGLAASTIAVIDDMLDRLAVACRSYAGDGMPAELLTSVDRALAQAVKDPNDSAREDALIGLVGIRRGLFPDAPAYRPRAGESVAA